ncbi:MAG: hypothetical protein HY736_20140 [Verrucomicrobia bacterium]|nr:hypothetical protein [Verrucomicrobiota bacterium]
MVPLHPRLRLFLDLCDALAIAAETGAQQVQFALRKRRASSYRTRRPGSDSPMWNVFVLLMRDELRPLGSKVRLARYLGVPKQRINDFLTGRSRLPDAELTLRMIHWLTERADGRDPAL